MKLYWSLDSIPEFRERSANSRQRIHRSCYWKSWRHWPVWASGLLTVLVASQRELIHPPWLGLLALFAAGALNTHIALLFVRRYVVEHLAIAHERAQAVSNQPDATGRPLRGLRGSVKALDRERKP